MPKPGCVNYRVLGQIWHSYLASCCTSLCWPRSSETSCRTCRDTFLGRLLPEGCFHHRSRESPHQCSHTHSPRSSRPRRQVLALVSALGHWSTFLGSKQAGLLPSHLSLPQGNPTPGARTRSNPPWKAAAPAYRMGTKGLITAMPGDWVFITRARTLASGSLHWGDHQLCKEVHS